MSADGREFDKGERDCEPGSIIILFHLFASTTCFVLLNKGFRIVGREVKEVVKPLHFAVGEGVVEGDW